MYSIRVATISDIPALRDLCFQVWPQTYSSIISQEQIDYMLDMMYSEASLRKQMEDGASFFFIDDDKATVGFASYGAMDGTVYKLHKLYVLPNQQGKGSGRFLIDHIIAEIKNKGARSLQLQVNKHNKALYFYQKLGFRVIEELVIDIGKGYIMDDYLMELVLAH